MRKILGSIFAISLAVLISSCAQLVKKNYGSNKGGTVKYKKELFLTEKNREKAMSLANDYCSPGRARTISEEDRSESNGYSSTETRHKGNKSYSSTTESRSNTVYLNFRCQNKHNSR